MKITINSEFSLEQLKQAVTNFNGNKHPLKRDVIDLITSLVDAEILSILNPSGEDEE